jgi:hypothetical protein
MTEPTNWPQTDIDYAAGELAREYRTEEGRVRLLQAARKNLSR